MAATDPAVIGTRPGPDGAPPGAPGPAPAAPAARSDHTPGRALWNVVTSYGALLVSSVTNILLTPILLISLGAADYGILRVTSSLFGYLGLLDLGVSTSIIYFVARYHSTGERAALNRFVSTIFNAIALLAAVSVAVCFVGAPAVVEFLRVPPDSVGEAEWVIRISSVLFAANLVGGVFGGILVGRGRFDVNNMISIGYLAGYAVGTFVLLRLGYGLLPVVVLNAALSAGAAGARVVVNGLLRLASVTVGLVSRPVLRGAVNYGFWSFLNNVASQLSFATTDMIVLSRILGVSTVAVYSVALAPVALITQLVFQCVDVFQPMITNLAYRHGGDRADVGRAFLLLTKTAVVLGWGPVLMLWLAGRQLLVLWVGDIGAQAGDLLIALTVAYGWNFVGHAAGLVLLGTANHRLLGIMAIIGSTLNVVLSVFFALRVGLLGVAYGTIVVMGITEMVILPVYCCRKVGLPVRLYVSLLLRAALTLLVGFAAGTAVGRAVMEAFGGWGPLGGWGATALECLVGGVLFLAAAWLVLFSRDERDLLLGVARGLLRRT
jgi:O-antigen/teichoic acid export membrane protein